MYTVYFHIEYYIRFLFFCKSYFSPYIVGHNRIHLNVLVNTFMSAVFYIFCKYYFDVCIHNWKHFETVDFNLKRCETLMSLEEEVI